MKHLLCASLSLALGLLSLPSLAGLIVVEDRGGASALPYYEMLNSSGSPAGPSVPKPIPRDPSAIEAAMLPVRSSRLSPGDEPPRAIRAPGLTPIFLVGDDDRSRAWLRQRYPALREMNAAGLAVSVASPGALDGLRRLAPGLSLSPASGDDLARRLGIRRYPALITAAGIRP